MIPFSKGGSNNTQNIRVLCQECNRNRGNDIEKF
ncbi:MAG: HNH endonuclease [Candidatus Lokiarchaeota archaeon]|nr:HNH endonuclease [Candidatus Lokiarchaeota archaeon]